MATSVPNSSKEISLKLLVDSQSRKVLFAEAGKEFVDFLFGLIHIPIGSMMGLLWNHGMAGPAGSWSRLYESIQNLDSTCLHQSKEKFLMPEPAFPSDTHPPPLLLNFVPPKQATGSVVKQPTSPFAFPVENRSVVKQPTSPFSFPVENRSVVSQPTGPFSFPVENRSVPVENRSVVNQPTSTLFEHRPTVLFGMGQDKETGYVRGVVTSLTFMVMDDLTVKPMSTISSITLLNTLNVKDVSLLQEMTVTVDIQKVFFTLS
jgi:hypothetical protein